jgi:hypothetical protein
LSVGNPTGSCPFHPDQVKRYWVAALLAGKWRRLSRARPYPVLLGFRE